MSPRISGADVRSCVTAGLALTLASLLLLQLRTQTPGEPPRFQVPPGPLAQEALLPLPSGGPLPRTGPDPLPPHSESRPPLSLPPPLHVPPPSTHPRETPSHAAPSSLSPTLASAPPQRPSIPSPTFTTTPHHRPCPGQVTALIDAPAGSTLFRLQAETVLRYARPFVSAVIAATEVFGARPNASVAPGLYLYVSQGLFFASPLHCSDFFTAEGLPIWRVSVTSAEEVQVWIIP